MHLQEVGAKLQQLLDSTVRGDKLIHHAVVGVAQPRSQFTWSGAAGYADGARQRAMQPETPVFLASVTKIYTAVAIMLLQERGKLALGDQIGKHLPGSLIQGIHRFKGTDYVDQLTIRHLISMTSGLADYSLDKPRSGKPIHERIFQEGDLEISMDEVIRMAREELTPKFSPAVPDSSTGALKAKAHYSDTNYHLLGAIIEAAAEKPLHAVFEEFYFQPLGMDQTYLYGYPRETTAGEPASIFYKERALNIPKMMKSVAPHGGIVSTVSDSLRFLQAVVQGELFARKDTFETMQQQWNPLFFPFQYSYGLMRFKMPRIFSPFAPTPELVGHSGSNGSFLYYCKEHDLYLAGTINQMTRQRAPFPLMLKIADLFRKLGR